MPFGCHVITINFEQSSHQVFINIFVEILKETCCIFLDCLDVHILHFSRGICIQSSFQGVSHLERKQWNFRTLQCSLLHIRHGHVIRVHSLVTLFDQSQSVTIFSLASRISIHPSGKFTLDSLFFTHRVQILQSDILLVRIFPIVSTLCIFRCILNTSGSRSVHSFFHDTQLLGTYFVTNIIGYIHRLFQTEASQETIGCSGESHDHGEITILYSFGRNRQMMFRFQRNITRVIRSRFAIRTRVDTHHTEVCRMTGPRPVVRVTTEFTHTLSRCAY